jgi:LPS-assembly protein
MVARGDARLVQGNFFLEADTIRYHKDTNIVTAEGEVEANYEALRLVTHFLEYDLANAHLDVDAFRVGQYPAYMSGDHLSGTVNTITAKKVNLFYGEPDYLTPNVYASEVSFFPQQRRVKVTNALIKIGPIPVFFLPAASHSTEEPPFSLKSRYGHRNNLGYFGQNTILFPITENIKLGALLDYYSKRSWLVGPAAQYALLNNATSMHGSVQAGFISDRGDRGTDILGAPIQRDRDFIKWRHKQTLYDQVELTGNLNAWSDSYVTRDFRPRYYNKDQRPDNFAEALYLGPGYYLSGFTRFRPNDFEQVAERLPEVAFHWVPSELFTTGVYQQIDASFVHLQEKQLSGAPERSTDRLDAYYGLTRPTHLNRWLTLTPVAGGRITSYNNSKGNLSGKSDYTRFIGQLGFDLDALAFGQWDYSSKRWGINGLRHTMRPKVQYRYIPNANQGQSNIPEIDSQVFHTYLDPIDLGTLRTVDQMSDENLMRLGFENALQTRASSGYGSRDLATLDLYQDIRFSRKQGENTLSPFYSILTLSPIEWLDLRLYNRFDIEDLTERELRTGLRIHDGDRWAVTFETDNLQHVISQYALGAEYRINPRNAVKGRWRYDSHRSELIEQAYGYWVRIANAWSVEFQLVFHKGSTRENGTQFNVVVELLSF